MNWRLFRKDDPNTWPKIDCPMLLYKVYGDSSKILEVHFWDKKRKQFYELGKWYKNYDECYYQYIGYIPDGYKIIEVQMCTTTAPCEFEDDGYCMHPNTSCPYCLKVNCYSLNDDKRIWKEFK